MRNASKTVAFGNAYAYVTLIPRTLYYTPFCDLVSAILGLVNVAYALFDLDVEHVPERRSATLVLKTCFSALCCYCTCTMLNPRLDVPRSPLYTAPTRLPPYLATIRPSLSIILHVSAPVFVPSLRPPSRGASHSALCTIRLVSLCALVGSSCIRATRVSRIRTPSVLEVPV